jgi:hypothetical protein
MAGSFFCHSIWNIFSSRLLVKNVKINIYNSTAVYVLCRHEIWSPALMEEYSLWLRIFGLKKRLGENLIMRSFIICTVSQILSR